MPVSFRRSIFTRMCTSSFGVSAMSGTLPVQVTQPATGPGESWSDGEGCWSGPVTFPAAVTQADPRASRPARAHLTLPTGRAGVAGGGDALVRPGAGAWSPACTWKQREAHGTHRKVQDDAGSRRRQPHPGGDASSAVVLVKAADRLLPIAPPPWLARGRQHRPVPSSRATGSVSFRASGSAARAGGRRRPARRCRTST